MKYSTEYIKSFLLADAPLHLHGIIRSPSDNPKAGILCHLRPDGVLFFSMDDDEDRADQCLRFLRRMDCAVFEDADEMQEYLLKLSKSHPDNP
ncbi:MAG: hypothetical protein R3C11_01675 [Planctomycetaceae bacterium]